MNFSKSKNKGQDNDFHVEFCRPIIHSIPGYLEYYTFDLMIFRRLKPKI